MRHHIRCIVLISRHCLCLGAASLRIEYLVPREYVTGAQPCLTPHLAWACSLKGIQREDKDKNTRGNTKLSLGVGRSEYMTIV